MPPEGQLRDRRNEALSRKRYAEQRHQVAWEAMMQATEDRKNARSALADYSILYLHAHIEYFRRHERLRRTRRIIRSISNHTARVRVHARKVRCDNDEKVLQKYTEQTVWLVQTHEQLQCIYTEIKVALVADRERLLIVSDHYAALQQKHNQCRKDLLRARKTFYSVRRLHDKARTAYEIAERDYQHACGVNTLWHALYSVDDLAALAEIDSMYLEDPEYPHNLIIQRLPTGKVQIFYGGIDTPNGEQHGHHVLIPPGKLHYKRRPFEAHGPHNFMTHEASTNPSPL